MAGLTGHLYMCIIQLWRSSSMLFRRLMASLVVVVGVALLVAPAIGQDDKKKDKDKDKKDDKDKGGQVKLEWKFKKGETFYQKMVTKTEQKMNVMNNDVNQ